ncbi:MAG: adenosylcobinamide-phosphate synthase CbiB [Rhizobiaceae bacterium]
MTVLVAFLALLVERVTGYPDTLYRLIGHPVTWIGAVIAYLDRTINRPSWSDMTRRIAGVAALLIMLVLAIGISAALVWLVGWGPYGIAVAVILASTLPAQKSLGSHVRDVADALDRGGLAEGRTAVSRIVGRDPERLDEAGVARAAIESLAENFSDGVVAPAIWTAVGGLAGGVAYKAVNTADSMIGHKTERHAAFGWASARFDDLVNLPASRLSGLLIVAASRFVEGASPGDAWRAIRRDAAKHKSPNAGWPEAAMAGALGIALAGPRHYHGVMVNDGFMGEGGRVILTSRDIRRALKLYWVADALLIGLIGVVAGILLVALP